jgi:alcohol dehydrogenase
MQSFNFATTKHIISAPGAIDQIAHICHTLHIARPLIVTDAGIIACGLLHELETQLRDAAIAFSVFGDVEHDPQETVINAGVEHARQSQCDGVIGFGGGSSMDSAKLIAILMHSQQDLSDIYGIDNVTTGRLPLILIPTTAGTGSEVTPISIITTGETTKQAVVDKALLPDVALLDAQLTLGLPAHVTAATGIDALVHAIEAYTSKIKKNPYSDMLAKEAIVLLSSHIKTATFDGSNIAARQAMLLGACLAGQAFANAPVAAVHALAYPLGGHFHIPHGLSNSLVLPHVLRFNASHCQKLYSELGKLVLTINEIANASSEQICQLFIEYIESLIVALGLPTSLQEMHITSANLPTLAADAMQQTRLLMNNPKPVTEQDALAIYQQAFNGLSHTNV